MWLGKHLLLCVQVFIYRGSTENAINPNIQWKLIDYAIYLTDHDFVHTRG